MINTTVDQNVLNQLALEAEDEGVTIKELIERILDEHVNTELEVRFSE